MALKRPSGSKSKFTKEVEEIKRLKDLNKILVAGDMENALLSNSAKDSETMNDNVLDQLLARADAGERGSERGLEVIERLTTSSPAGKTVTERKVKVRAAGGKIKSKKSIHVKKAAKKRRR